MIRGLFLHLSFACVATLFAAESFAAARGAPDAVQWTKLTSAQQSFLAPLKSDWSQLEPAQQLKWQEVAVRAPAMPASERDRVQERMGEWARLTPAQRTQARLQFQEVRQVPQDERQARWQAYQALSEAERQQLSQRAQPAAGKASGPVRTVVVRPPATSASAPQAVTPILLQARPGATTTAMKPQAGMPGVPPSRPRIAAGPKDVDPATLLPKAKPATAAAAPAASGSTEGSSQQP